MTNLLTVCLLVLMLTCGKASAAVSSPPPSNDVNFNMDRGHRLTLGSYSLGYLEVTERFASQPTKTSTLVYFGGFQVRVPLPVTAFQLCGLVILLVLVVVLAFAGWAREHKREG